ncbi:MAG: hypothetical protein LBR56_05855 [Sporomusaceae bacterium]|jgi:hypothetical protein|nr:hypothetical protein [Sporomusaceae bacterium]
MIQQENKFMFKLFEPRRSRQEKNDDPIVAVKPNGRIVFNKRAAMLLNDNHFCMLGYDGQNQALGILPLTETKSNAFPVRYAAKGAYIGAKKFFKHFNILPGQLIEHTPFQNGDFIGVKL